MHPTDGEPAKISSTLDGSPIGCASSGKKDYHFAIGSLCSTSKAIHLRMESFASVHSIARWSCWRLLHLGYFWITWCVGFVSYLQRSLCCPSSHRVKKLPRHLALLVDSEDVILHLSNVIMLLQQLAQLGVRHISLYDAKGNSKVVLPGALKGNSILQAYSHTALCEAGDECVACEAPPCEGKGCLLVELLSLSDGKQAIVDAARYICLKSLQSGALPNLREDDIDISLKETGGIGPDPDLLLLFSNSRCLQGYPPWRLRLTEIQYMGSIKDVSEQTIFVALDEFSHKNHRYGK